jgi:hypothetical protein
MTIGPTSFDLRNVAGILRWTGSNLRYGSFPRHADQRRIMNLRDDARVD